jgi:hypothetical protein
LRRAASIRSQLRSSTSLSVHRAASFSLVASHADAIFTGTPSSVTANPLDTTEFFIRQHYLDFLGREPDLGGLNYWSTELDKCKVDDACVRRQEFMQKYSNATSAESLVDTLIQTMRQASGADLANRRGALLAKYNSGADINEARSLAVREAIEDASFKQAEYNKSFVLMQYFGYLKRDPDQGGYDFWLGKVTNNYREMVCAFITSREYQLRFVTIVTRHDNICSSTGL